MLKRARFYPEHTTRVAEPTMAADVPIQSWYGGTLLFWISTGRSEAGEVIFDYNFEKKWLSVVETKITQATVPVTCHFYGSRSLKLLNFVLLRGVECHVDSGKLFEGVATVANGGYSDLVALEMFPASNQLEEFL